MSNQLEIPIIIEMEFDDPISEQEKPIIREVVRSAIAKHLKVGEPHMSENHRYTFTSVESKDIGR